jgi:tetratricopeptide (TPR) repeat protein
LNNLAGLYKSQGRYSDAEPLYSDALAMRKRLFAGDHPDVATSLNNLALLYYSQGSNTNFLNVRHGWTSLFSLKVANIITTNKIEQYLTQLYSSFYETIALLTKVGNLVV